MSSSGSVATATNSRHSHLFKTHSRLSKLDRSSGPPISAEPAHNNREKAPPRNSDPDLRDVGSVSNQGASSTGDRCYVTRLAGEVDVHVFTIPPA